MPCKSAKTFAFLAILSAAPVVAQDGGWHFVLQPYLMLPTMDGSATVRGFDANVDVGARAVIENLNIGFLGYVEANNGAIAFGVDANYMNLDANPDSSRTRANVSQTAVQPMLFYRVVDNLELMAGLRYNNIYLKLDSDIAFIDGQDRTKDWLDPIVGFRFSGPLFGSTRFSLLANVGGFGIGSDIAIQTRPMLSFGVGSGLSIDVGYQLVYMDYESGSGSDRFAYDVLTSGPILGITFRF